MNFETPPIDSIADIPPNLSDEEQIEFFETHGFSEKFWEQAEPVPADEKLRARARRAESVKARLDGPTLSRVKALAKRRGVEHHALLNDLLEQALNREEELERPTEPGGSSNAPKESAEKRDPGGPPLR